jgi:hypothetical protein
MHFKKWVKSYVHASKKCYPSFLLKIPKKMEIEGEELTKKSVSASIQETPSLIKRITPAEEEPMKESNPKTPMEEENEKDSLMKIKPIAIKKTKITDLEIQN